jgi:hypothetical protein
MSCHGHQPLDQHRNGAVAGPRGHGRLPPAEATTAHSGHRDHPFRTMAITRSGASRSPSPVMAITGSERSDAGAGRCSSSPPSSVQLLRRGHGTSAPGRVSSPTRGARPSAHRHRGAWGRSRPPRARRIAGSGAAQERRAMRGGRARRPPVRAGGQGVPHAPPPRVARSGPVGAKRRARSPRAAGVAVEVGSGVRVRGHESCSWPADLGFRRDGPFNAMRCAA